tara:strand:- start:960 stop:1181 length:222 start_codon:yes stop_codon:yes gene_type:complete
MFTTNELRMIEEALSKYSGYYASEPSRNYAWRDLSSKVHTERVDSQCNPFIDDDGNKIPAQVISAVTYKNEGY